MFNQELLEDTIEGLLKGLLWRTLILLICSVLVLIYKPGVLGLILIYSIPLMVLQVIFDKKIIVPKLGVLFVWVGVLIVVQMIADWYGLVGMTLFFVLYYLYRFYTLKNDPALKFGVDLIKNSFKYAKEMEKNNNDTNENKKRKIE